MWLAICCVVVWITNFYFVPVLAQKRDTQQIQSLSLKFDKPVDGDASAPVSYSYIILQLNRSSMLLIVIDDLLTERPRSITSYFENREMQCLNI